MATSGQFYWPSVGTFVAAYGQFFMAANTRREKVPGPGRQKPASGVKPGTAGRTFPRTAWCAPPRLALLIPRLALYDLVCKYSGSQRCGGQLFRRPMPVVAEACADGPWHLGSFGDDRPCAVVAGSFYADPTAASISARMRSVQHTGVLGFSRQDSARRPAANASNPVDGTSFITTAQRWYLSAATGVA